jgi:hypothetical protein
MLASIFSAAAMALARTRRLWSSTTIPRVAKHSSRKRIGPHLEPINLKLGAVVCDAGGLLKRAYFSEGSVLSLLTVLESANHVSALRGVVAVS